MGNPDKIVAVGLGEVLYDHDVVTDEYTFGGAPEYPAAAKTEFSGNL